MVSKLYNRTFKMSDMQSNSVQLVMHNHRTIPESVCYTLFYVCGIYKTRRLRLVQGSTVPRPTRKIFIGVFAFALRFRL